MPVRHESNAIHVIAKWVQLAQNRLIAALAATTKE
jgi:hypothetical protein